MFIRNCWSVAGWPSEVVDQDFLARTIIDVPIALWRRADGEVVAFEEDRTMITLQVDNLARRPDFEMHGIRADAALARFRWMVAKMLKEESATSGPPVVPIEPSRVDPVSA